MEQYTQEEINNALKAINGFSHEEMCRMWRFGGTFEDLYFRSDLPTGKVFKDRLFTHFGGFTSEISKKIGL